MLWWSVIPLIITLVAVLKTRKVIISLFLGLAVGAFIKVPSPSNGFIELGRYLANTIVQKENSYTLLFLVMFGALAELIQMAGGVAGFSQAVGKRVKTERQVLLSAWLLSAVTFFNSAFHIISVGTILEPLINRVKGSKEKLAFVLSITTGQLIVLVPVATAYVGYMVTLVRFNLQQEELNISPYITFLKSLPWNLFSIIMLGIAMAVTLWGLNYGKYRLGKSAAKEEFTESHRKKERLVEQLQEEYPQKTANLVLPILVLLASTIFFFWWTGKTAGGSILDAFARANFTVSILAGTLLTLSVTFIFLWMQKINLAEIQAHTLEGAQSIFGSLAILVLGWSLTTVVKDLGFLELVKSSFSGSVPVWAVPVLSFLMAVVTSYAIGSSWATWALIMPVAIGLGRGLPPEIMIGAVWAGGSVGDTASPMGDIPVLASGVLGISPSQYIESALPFTILGIILATMGYLIIGIFA